MIVNNNTKDGFEGEVPCCGHKEKSSLFQALLSLTARFT
jgi:hypothetical protein